ncbi:hypothetical protein EYZ11_004851 [Aspergillus tanneri]|uniref:Uncharacterized protein n=1 Tax=Aspergillus tanneri TaxID=1220188 RepID=A0A4V3UPL8_9EURO|nr:uncharacterized protein ATNIH1004_006154 [Aspergillus tanneri]KAA8647461.1 hypothetical protein ATNIH1004_006154 [Aspergillus tanneri]THC95684.1 hypothetical protein EYZ11_004851 [Aspergillus tanneri]
MAPNKPVLHPLTTPKTMSFPSELRERTYTCLDSFRPDGEVKKEDVEDTEISMTPPPAYTDFINTFSPIFSSPRTSRANFSKYMLDKPRPSPTSAPSSTTSTFFSSGNNSRDLSARSPPSATDYSARRLRLPPPYAYTPPSDSPRHAYPLRSAFPPSEMRLQQYDSSVGDKGGCLSVRHVVTTTITYKRTPQLAPPPQGKRRRNADA